MMEDSRIFSPILFGVLSLLISLGATAVVRWFARSYGYVAKPKMDRWHRRPTAMLGGVSIFLTTIILSVFVVPLTFKFLVLMCGSTFLFLVGLIDDLLHIKPYQKLFGQIIGVAFIVGNGLVLPWTGSDVANIAITSFWLIGITNAINLLDNMDGLAAGISAIAAFILAISFGTEGQVPELIIVSIFIGALVGFLVFNFNPASIFMGDCGSMFVGFFLASSVLLTDIGGRSRSVFSVLAVPALILFVPIFDTTLVTILRKIRGRKASQGGRDHTSHRLVALGLSEKSAVLMLYGFALLAGGLSLLVRELRTTQSIALIGLFVVVLTITGVYLSKVKVYEEQQEELALANNAMYGFLLNVSHKRRIFEILLDACLITLSYYASYVLLFGQIEDTQNWTLFISTLPILIVLKLFAFLFAGVYRGLWRYTSVRDFVTFAKGVLLGSTLSVVAILLLYRFQNFSRTVFLVDGIILFMALAASRMAFRLFRHFLPVSGSADGRRVLIYGAGDGGELVLRELRNNPTLNYLPIGFIDDDPLKMDKVIHGLRVFGGNGSLPKICLDNEIDEILISCRDMSKERLSAVRLSCIDSNVGIQRATLKIEPIEFE